VIDLFPAWQSPGKEATIRSFGSLYIGATGTFASRTSYDGRAIADIHLGLARIGAHPEAFLKKVYAEAGAGWDLLGIYDSPFACWRLGVDFRIITLARR
jgi:hypothetical protein